MHLNHLYPSDDNSLDLVLHFSINLRENRVLLINTWGFSTLTSSKKLQTKTMTVMARDCRSQQTSFEPINLLPRHLDYPCTWSWKLECETAVILGRFFFEMKYRSKCLKKSERNRIVILWFSHLFTNSLNRNSSCFPLIEVRTCPK